MNYKEARNLIKTGDMLLFRNHPGGSLRSKIERMFVLHGTASPYVHVGVAWVEHDRVWVMDMTTKGCSPRLLSKAGDFDLASAPRELSKEALVYAFEQFGELEYSKWQAIQGALNTLKLNKDKQSQCAEYALGIYATSLMLPTSKATPAACADGALINWGSSIISVKNS